MRVPNETLDGQPWRIREVLGDFPLEDLWQMPDMTGTRGEFDDLIEQMTTANPSKDAPAAVRFLWNVRDVLGRWLDLGEIAAATDEPPPHTLRHNVPYDLRGTADDVHFSALPFVPLYRTDTEFAAEVANRTVHGVMHLGWLQVGDDRYTPQMAVFVRPNGVFGRAYMQFIKPFRYAIVYPALEKQMARQWQNRSRA
ncbi:MAG TPA: DUF2867 domain-containing protein [Aeromicrobium sp.]|nr:DUF2867 domain-containing protein [Aeromicrobium sp.]